jgi:hypothetical protein
VFWIYKRELAAFTLQPVVLRSNLHPKLKDCLCASLLAIGASVRTPSTLAEFGLERFAPITYEHCASEEQALRECERSAPERAESLDSENLDARAQVAGPGASVSRFLIPLNRFECPKVTRR